jgi:hypothetical protein
MIHLSVPIHHHCPLGIIHWPLNNSECRQKAEITLSLSSKGDLAQGISDMDAFLEEETRQ